MEENKRISLANPPNSEFDNEGQFGKRIRQNAQ
jgi:hypothetical protein